MGTVYQALDLALERTVAIKVLKRELTDDQKFVETFLREVEITASLTHPNVVQVFAFGEQDGHYYLVMEYISSPNLDDMISERKRLSEAEVLDIGIGVAQGLSFANQHGGLVHRDIKPGNILFGADNTPKVVDFGLALTPETTDHFAGEIWGTPFYMSPERLEGIPEEFSSDMYSLGTTLYHALTGRPPFDAPTAEDVAMKHLQEPQTNANAGITRALTAALPVKTYAKVTDQTSYTIMRAMARHPEQRFGSYDEFIGQLHDAKRRLAAQQSAKATAAQSANQGGVSVSGAASEESNTGLIIGIVVGALIFLLIVGFVIAWRFKLLG